MSTLLSPLRSLFSSGLKGKLILLALLLVAWMVLPPLVMFALHLIVFLFKLAIFAFIVGAVGLVGFTVYKVASKHSAA